MMPVAVKQETTNNALLKLPLPSIEQSVNALIEAIQPLQSAEEFQKTIKRLNNLKTNKLLHTIQEHLEEYDSKHACYLDLFSNVRDHNATNIYSEYRGKTLPKNPYFILENDPNYWSLLPPKQSERAAILGFSTLKFISALKKHQITSDVSPNSQRPLAMKSFGYLFGSTRYPSEHGHGINIKHFADSKHVAILCDGKFYRLQVLNDANEIIIGQSNLQKIFDQIISTAEKDHEVFKQSISSITSESIEEWYNLRKLLSSNELNAKSLETLDSALLLINLDLNNFIIDDKHSNYLNICHGTSNIDDDTGEQRGSCNSRWYDKLQLIVSKDSLASVVWEPTSNDANVVLRYVSDIYTDSILRLARNINNLKLFSLWPKTQVHDVFQDDHAFFDDSLFSELKWDLSDPYLLHRLHLAETRLGDLLSQYDSRIEMLKFGKLFAKSINLNADSLIQLAIQLTHYALYGKMVSSCESISTRRFENSRSELCFIQSPEILRIAQNFISNASDKSRWEYIKQGVEQINQLKQRCRNGYGFEKHIKALKLSYIQRNYLNQIKPDKVATIPSISELPAKHIPRFIAVPDESSFRLIFDPEILAINCGNPSLKSFGITPYKPDGFGIGYIIKDDYTVVTISSNFRQNKRFLDTLSWVFTEIGHLHAVCEKKTNFASGADSDADAAATATATAAADDNRTPYTTAEMIRSVSMTLTESMNRDDEALEDEEKTGTSSKKKKKHEVGKDLFNPDFILGGYGYFDVGELEFRSHSNSRQISRAQSSSNLKSIKE